MGSGYLSGLIWGGVVSLIVLAAISLSTPLPDRAGEAPAAVETPAAAVPPEPEPVPEPEPQAAGGTDPATPAEADAQSTGAAEPPAEADAQSTGAAEPPAEADAAPTADPDAADPDAGEGREEGNAEDAPAEGDEDAGLRDTPPDSAQTALVPGARLQEAGALAAASPDARPSLPRIDPATGASAPPASSGTPDPGGTPPVAETMPAPQPAVAAAPESPIPAAAPAAPPPRFSAIADASAGGSAPRRVVMPQAADTLGAIETAPPAPPPAPEEAVVRVAPAATETDIGTAMPEPAAPGADPVVSVPAAPTPDATVPQPVRLPQVLPATPEDEGTAPESGAMPSDTAPRLPRIGTGITGSSIRLPQAGDAVAPATPAEEPDASVPDMPDMADTAPADALRDNAVAFTAPDSPLMAVVLIDEPGSALDPEVLTRFTFPVTFAIDPMRSDAARRAADLHDAGFEVVILGAAAIAEGALPADVETALAVARETMPQAVALMDDPDSRIQGDRAVLDATVAALAETGHGLVAFPRGLNAAEETARRTGLPAATAFRLLDDEDQRATVITRYLGRAAFAAGQEGAVVVVGRTRPDTVTALFSWALGSRSEQVTLAPLSAALLRLSE